MIPPTELVAASCLSGFGGGADADGLDAGEGLGPGNVPDAAHIRAMIAGSPQ